MLRHGEVVLYRVLWGASFHFCFSLRTAIEGRILRRNGNCKPLVDVARSEKDIKMKLRLVERLSNMTRSCQAASDYLTELLSK